MSNMKLFVMAILHWKQGMFTIPPNREIWLWQELTCLNISLLRENMQTIVLILTQIYLNQSLNIFL